MTLDDRTDPQSEPPSPSGQRRHRTRGRGAVLVAALALAAVSASAAASAALSDEQVPVPAEQQLQAEIDGMIEAGLPEDDPKVEMVEDQLEALEDGARVPARRERGVDTGALLAEAETADESLAATERGARTATADATVAGDAAGWESGTILCEPLPGLLSIDELAGATCLSIPQPDGTSRYVAVAPDGVVRSIHFGNDGDVYRLDDARLPSPAVPGASFAPTPEGDLQMTPPGGPTATVDVP